MYSSARNGSTSTLWMIPASGGMPEPLAIAGENATFVSVSRSGARLVYEHEALRLNIWRIPGPNSPAKSTAPARFIASTQSEEEPQFAPDGKKIVFSSNRSGKTELWTCDREGRNAVQLTSFNGPPHGSPRWSPDSRWIAFDCPKAGNYDIFVISADGGLPRRLTTGPPIYFGSDATKRPNIWKLPVQGGPALQVTKRNGSAAFESPDGKFVYYR